MTCLGGSVGTQEACAMCALVATVATSVQTLAWPPGSNPSAPNWKASLWENDSGILCFLAVGLLHTSQGCITWCFPPSSSSGRAPVMLSSVHPSGGTQVRLSGLGQHLSYALFLRTSMHLSQHMA